MRPLLVVLGPKAVEASLLRPPILRRRPRRLGLQRSEAGLVPYLQFGEVQWWYFQYKDAQGQLVPGMPFYDDYTLTTFQSQYGRAMHEFLTNNDSPDPYPEESEFLPGLIGAYTAAIRAHVAATYPQTRFEVLYPHDVNDYALTRVVNFPANDWAPANLDVLKTENFTYTGARNLNQALESIRFPLDNGFPRDRSAHLVGIFNAREPWDSERKLSLREGVESVVMWAFDQFLMIGYPVPLRDGPRRARFLR